MMEGVALTGSQLGQPHFIREDLEAHSRGVPAQSHTPSKLSTVEHSFVLILLFRVIDCIMHDYSKMKSNWA